MIVTLAGHVDHGKTTLVRLLTGTDTYRQAEERRRGLTIDLGFAYLADGGQVVGFVDVPGHHRFIHNMVAGVAAHQYALLVVAADDGPMPQSREHLQILSLIGVRRGMVALTKCDRVDAARLAAARSEVAALVGGTFLEGCEVIETSATTGSGLLELRAALLSAARDTRLADGERPFRMAIDRAFTLRGAGLVVTGTVHSGAIAVDQEIHHFPTGKRARIRELHVQNQLAQEARTGDRAALNLVGLDAAEIARGHWITATRDPGHHHLVIELEVLDDFPRAIRQWLPVHVYHATSHTTARLAQLNASSEAAPNRTSTDAQTATRVWAELHCDAPLFAKHGDRLVIRDQGLDRTLGGGRVLDNRTPPRRRRTPARLASIAAFAAAEPAAALRDLLALDPVDLDAFRRVWDLTSSDVTALVAESGATRHGNFLVREGAWQAWSAALLTECEERHSQDEALQGLQENAFECAVPNAFRNDLLRELVAAGRLEQRAGRYRPARHKVVLSRDEAELLRRLEPLLAQPQPMSLGDIGRTLKLPLISLQKAVRPLVAKGALVQINDKRLYLPDDVATLATTAAELATRGPFSAAEFRDAAGIGRNAAIDLLEFFDVKRFTRRQGDARIVVGDPARVAET
jgi:selenocysteine-specific elongation factor